MAYVPTSFFSGKPPGANSLSHLHMPGSACTGDGATRLLGTTKLSTSKNAARIPNMDGYLVFIIPPKCCKLRKSMLFSPCITFTGNHILNFFFGDLRRNSTATPPVLGPLNGESIPFFLLGICYSPPLRAAPRTTQEYFPGFGLYVPERGQLFSCLGWCSPPRLALLRITPFPQILQRGR